MSGIVSIYFFNDKTIEASTINNMLDHNSIARRGLDSKDIWINNSIGLGRCSSHTKQKSEYKDQPLISKHNNLRLVMDGRIDNKKELLDLLSSSNKPSPMTDADYVLMSYEIWKEKCVEKLVGDFVFILWDGNQNKLFCARDCIGVKPLYYYQGKDFIALASDPGGIFNLPFIEKKINIDMATSYLTGTLHTKETFFTNLYQLQAAHSLTITKNQIKSQQYWSLDSNKKIFLTSDEEYRECFLDLLSKSIIDKLHDKDKVGILLSGGFDSSSIFCLIEELKSKNRLNTNITGYTATFDEKEVDESNYIRSIEKKWDAKIHKTKPLFTSPIWELDEGLRVNTGPLVLKHYLTDELFKYAQNDGCTTILTGIGGDDFFNLNPFDLYELIPELNKTQAWELINNSSVFYKTTSLTFLYKTLKYHLAQSILQPLKLIYKKKQFYNKYRWINSLGLKKKFEELQEGNHKNNFKSISTGYINIQCTEWDRIASSKSIELIHPFCDRRLVEFAYQIPRAQIIQGLIPKGLLRETFKGILPNTIRNREGKTRFNYLSNKNLGVDNRDLAYKLLSSSCLEELGVINKEPVLRMYLDFCNDCKDEKKINNLSNHNIWYLLSLENWLQKTQ